MLSRSNTALSLDRTGFEIKSSFLPPRRTRVRRAVKTAIEKAENQMKSVRISSSLSVFFQLLCLSISFGFFGLAERRRSKQRCAAKRVPYTAKSNLASTRSSYLLLRAGALAAHRVNRLMLLGSPSDMVHSSRLRKTHPSTQGIRLNSKRSDPQVRDPPLL